MNSIEIKELGNAEIELTGEIPVADFAAQRADAINRLNREVTLDGFRQGHAPEAVLVAKLGEERVLLEMAELALTQAYPKIVSEKSLEVIGRPEITITKLAKDNPLGFKIKTAVYPRFSLPPYRAIAAEINGQPSETASASDEEVANVLEEIRRSRANPETKTLPELTDELAQSLGEFKTLDELKTKIKENLKLEKEHKAKDKKRLTIMDGLIAKTDIPLPPILVASELDRMVAELKQDIERLGLKFDDYLAHLKKTESELRAAWQSDAEKRVKTSLLLSRLAEAESIKPDEAAIEAEIKHLQSHYKEAPLERVRSYVLSALTNEAVWQFLENQK